MTFRFKGITVKVSYLFLAVVGLFLINDESFIAKNAVLTAFIHELGHLTAMSFLNCVPKTIAFQSFGIKIEKSTALTLNYNKEMIIYFAGPAMNIICALILILMYYLKIDDTFFQTALIHIFTALFNLLPIGVLDGGNILRSFLKKHMYVNTAEIVENTVSAILILPMAVISIMLIVSNLHNYTLMITCAYLIFMLILQKER